LTRSKKSSHKAAQTSLNIGEIKASKFKSCDISNDKLLFYKHGKSGNVYVINYGGDAFVKRLEKPDKEGYSSIFG
jgi:hypothetical protein